MMNIYVVYEVTQELKTLWWLKTIRFIKLKPKMKTFLLTMNTNTYSKGDIIYSGNNTSLKVLGRVEYVAGYDPVTTN